MPNWKDEAVLLEEPKWRNEAIEVDPEPAGPEMKPESESMAPFMLKREQREGVWGFNQQLDGLFSGRTDLTDLVPADVGYNFGRVVGMSDPEDAKARAAGSIMYSVMFDMPQEIAFDNIDSLNKQIFGKELSPTAAWRANQNIYKDTKTWVETIKHGKRNLGMSLAKAAIGKTKMLGEYLSQEKGDRYVKNVVDEWLSGKGEEMAEWSDTMLAEVKRYYEEHQEEAIQIVPGIGYRETLREYITHPKKLVQGLVESSGLMLEAMAGTLVAGPAGGITTTAFMMTGDRYADARAEGTDVLPAMAEDIFGSVIEAGIEQWTLGKKLGLVKNAKKIVSSGVPKVMWESTKAFFRGTAEEGTQQFDRNFFKWLFTDRSQLWSEGVAEAAAAGGPMEMIMAGGFATAGMVVGPTVSKEEQLARLDSIETAITQMPTDAQKEIKALLKTARKDVNADVYPETVEEKAEEPGMVKTKGAADYAKQIKKLIIPWSEMRQRLAAQAEAAEEGPERDAFQQQIDELDEQQARHMASIAQEGLKETEATITPEEQRKPALSEAERVVPGEGIEKQQDIEKLKAEIAEREAGETDEQLSGITKKRRKSLIKETAAKIEAHDVYQNEMAGRDVSERQIGTGFYYVHESGRGEVESVIPPMRAKDFAKRSEWIKYKKLMDMFTFDRADATSGRATAWDVAVQVGYENVEEQADMDLQEFVQRVKDAYDAGQMEGALNQAAFRNFEKSGYPDAEMLAEKYSMLKRGASDIEINDMITDWADRNDVPIEAVIDEFVNADKMAVIAEMSDEEQDAELERLATEQILAEDQIAAQTAAVDVLEANGIKAEVRTVEEIQQGLAEVRNKDVSRDLLGREVVRPISGKQKDLGIGKGTKATAVHKPELRTAISEKLNSDPKAPTTPAEMLKWIKEKTGWEELFNNYLKPDAEMESAWDEAVLGQTFRFERGKATGAAMTIGQREVILLALGADIETGAHEGWHLLRNRLTNEDLATLMDKYGPGLRGEEVEAAAFGRFYKENKAPSNAIRKIFEKIKRILAKIKSALQGKGFRTVEDIFGSAMAGTIEKRGTKDAARGTKFEQKQPVWYSKLERAVETSMPNKMDSAAFRGWADKQGIKKEEMLWSGVDELLTKKETITRQDVLDTIAANNVQIEEVVKGGKAADAKERNLHVITEELRVLENKIDDAWHSLNAKLRQVPDEQRDKYGIGTAEQRNALVDEVAYLDKEPQQRAIKKIEEILPEYDINEILDLIDEQTELKHEREVIRAEQEYGGNEPKFSQYKLPGGENYREVLLTLPERGEREVQQQADGLFKVVNDRGETIATNLGLEAAQQALTEATGRAYKSPHWSELNVLAHFRMDDRTDKAGKKVLFIEEIQSDWHEKGRERGYKGDIKDRSKAPPEYEIRKIKTQEGPAYQVYDKYKDNVAGTAFDTEKHALEIAWIHYDRSSTQVPNAPFKKTEAWMGLAFKRILRYAAEGGYETVAWTTGEQQAARYDLSKQVDEIGWNPDTRLLNAKKGGQTVIRQEVDGSKLVSFVGKEAAEKLLSNKYETSPETSRQRVLRGLDLKVGGEGMKGFYDKMLPAFAKKYMKKWGVKDVGETEIEKYEGSPSLSVAVPGTVTVHSVPVTAAMTESVMAGQVKFETSSQKWRRETEQRARINARKARLKAQQELVPSKKRKKKGPAIRRLKINIREVTPALRADLLPEDLDKVIGSAIPGAEEIPKSSKTLVKPVYDKAWFDRNMEVQGRSVRDKSSSEGKRAWIALEKKFTPMSTRLFNIAPKLFQATRKFVYDQMTRTVWLSDEVSPFVHDIKKMDKDDRRAMDLALKNGIDWKIAELNEKYGIQADYEKARAALDEIYEAAKDVGIKIEYMKNYWPRILSDKEGFLMYFQGLDNWSIIEEMIKKRAEQAGRQVQDMTPDEIAQDINVLMRGYQLQNLTLSRPGAAKERTVESVTAEIDSFYDDSLTAVYKYIKQMTAKIGEREFFGRETKLIQSLRKTQRARLTRLTKLKRRVGLKGATEERYKEHISKTYEAWMATNERLTRLKARPLTDTIGGYIDRIRRAGLIKPSQEIQVQDILGAIFNPTRMGRITSMISSGIYLDTLNSPLQAITQLDEFAYSFFRDPVRSIPALITTIARQSKVTPKDIGITSIGEEFQGPSMQRALGLLLKSTGFEEIDRLNKENYINTVLRKYQSQARNAENNPDFVKRMQKVFGDEYQGVIADLKKGEITENVKYLLFNELLDIQPLAISEMPESYAKAGGWRLAYSLKSFYIRRLDYVRNECFKDMKSKDTFARGFGKLVWLSFSFALMGAGSDAIKDFIRGKKFDLTDSLVDNLLRMMFFSKYQAWRTREKGFGTAVMEGWRPPTKAIDSLSKDIINTAMGKDRGFELWRSVPIVGEEYYWWFGEGRRKIDSRSGTRKNVIR